MTNQPKYSGTGNDMNDIDASNQSNYCGAGNKSSYIISGIQSAYDDTGSQSFYNDAGNQSPYIRTAVKTDYKDALNQSMYGNGNDQPLCSGATEKQQAATEEFYIEQLERQLMAASSGTPGDSLSEFFAAQEMLSSEGNLMATTGVQYPIYQVPLESVTPKYRRSRRGGSKTEASNQAASSVQTTLCSSSFIDQSQLEALLKGLTDTANQLSQNSTTSSNNPTYQQSQILPSSAILQQTSCLSHQTPPVAQQDLSTVNTFIEQQTLRSFTHVTEPLMQQTSPSFKQLAPSSFMQQAPPSFTQQSPPSFMQQTPPYTQQTPPQTQQIQTSFTQQTPTSFTQQTAHSLAQQNLSSTQRSTSQLISQQTFPSVSQTALPTLVTHLQTVASMLQEEPLIPITVGAIYLTQPDLLGSSHCLTELQYKIQNDTARRASTGSLVTSRPTKKHVSFLVPQVRYVQMIGHFMP